MTKAQSIADRIYPVGLRMRAIEADLRSGRIDPSSPDVTEAWDAHRELDSIEEALISAIDNAETDRDTAQQLALCAALEAGVGALEAFLSTAS